jgi:hypothetical protein
MVSTIVRSVWPPKQVQVSDHGSQVLNIDADPVAAEFLELCTYEACYTAPKCMRRGELPQ